MSRFSEIYIQGPNSGRRVVYPLGLPLSLSLSAGTYYTYGAVPLRLGVCSSQEDSETFFPTQPW